MTNLSELLEAAITSNSNKEAVRSFLTHLAEALSRAGRQMKTEWSDDDVDLFLAWKMSAIKDATASFVSLIHRLSSKQ